jgi:7-cyano-7-deazaguanine reductase
MNWKTDTLLGQQVAAPMDYQPGILMGIDRALGRQLLSQPDLPGLQQGHDDWHVFELSWLEAASGRRCVGLARLRFNAASPRLIESKSLKLYFNSLNFLPLDSADALRALVERDLSPVSGAPVQCTLLPLDGLTPELWTGQAIDAAALPLQPTRQCAEVDPALLQHRPGADGEETLISHLFRSNCPVTGQPDWASVRIRYHGQPWQHGALLAYLLSYGQHCGFHEQCVEQIYHDLWVRLNPTDLMVQAAYTRRGGLDINPVRSSRADWMPAPTRLHRQ